MAEIDVPTVFWNDMDADYLSAEIQSVYPEAANRQGAQKHAPPDAWGFKQFSQQVFDDLGYPTITWDYWISVLDGDSLTHQKEGEIWIKDFPHDHSWNDHLNLARTLLLYVQKPLEGGETVIYNDERTERVSVTPEPGKGVIVGGAQYHGMRPCVGTRIVLISTGFERRRGFT